MMIAVRDLVVGALGQEQQAMLSQHAEQAIPTDLQSSSSLMS